MLQRAEMANAEHDRNRGKREQEALKKQDNIEYMLRNKNNEDEYIEFRLKNKLDINRSPDKWDSPRVDSSSPMSPSPVVSPAARSWREDELLKKANSSRSSKKRPQAVEVTASSDGDVGTLPSGSAANGSPPNLQRRGSRASTIPMSTVTSTNPHGAPDELFSNIGKNSVLALGRNLGRKEVLAELAADSPDAASGPADAKYMSHAATPRDKTQIASRQRRMSVAM
jgi:hypothetical protein